MPHPARRSHRWLLGPLRAGLRSVGLADLIALLGIHERARDFAAAGEAHVQRHPPAARAEAELRDQLVAAAAALAALDLARELLLANGQGDARADPGRVAPHFAVVRMLV